MVDYFPSIKASDKFEIILMMLEEKVNLPKVNLSKISTRAFWSFQFWVDYLKVDHFNCVKCLFKLQGPVPQIITDS
jgi:hypothetical protein